MEFRLDFETEILAMAYSAAALQFDGIADDAHSIYKYTVEEDEKGFFLMVEIEEDDSSLLP